ncbi:MAG: hypothetical protein K9W43_11170 [Candidatus Thorarchaeota archaeon]|nr:hypothetical protein [Candidatus Thorarchaeota archaeon]
MKKTLILLPNYFEAKISISGIEATDIFTLGSLIAAAIETNIVASLNKLHSVWDPDDKYTEYYFIREAEIFPDVRLVKKDNPDPLLGIELKSWYLLSKEKVPSARFKVNANACTEQDLLVLYPWALENVLSGQPIIFNPFIKPCRYVAEYRNWWWQKQRATETSRKIMMPTDVKPYPTGREKIEDKPEYNGGHNFGRIARTGVMSKYIKDCLKLKVAGVPAMKWIDFFKTI